MSLVLVTGGAGFIGSHICEKLLKDGFQVRVLDNLDSGKADNLATFRKGIDFVRSDIRDAEIVRKAVEGVECIFHQAAQVAIPRSVKDPMETNEINIKGTLSLLEEARRQDVKKVIFASSSAVYGNVPQEELPLKENRILSPLSPYAVTKLMGEHYCRVFSELYGIQTICLRYLNVYGPRQNPESQYAAVIPKFVHSITGGERPTVFGDGLQTRDFVFVKDVVQANVLAMRSKLRHEVFNVGTGTAVNLLELIDRINRISGKDAKPVFREPGPGDIKHSVADITNIKDELGYIPSYTLEDGLKQTVEWFTSSRKPSSSSRPSE